MLTIALAIVLGYLCGSIPFAYIVARAVRGTDIRASGNVGTLSVVREVGLAPGVVVLALDMGKGAVAILAARWLDTPMLAVFFAGLAAVAGHSWPVFLRFRGGGALATTLGVLAGLVPLEFGISFVVMVVAVLFTSNVRFGAAVGLLCLPPLIWLFGGELSVIIYSIVLPVILVLRNVTRFKGEQSRGRGAQGLIVDREHTPWQTKRKERKRDG